MARIRQLKPEFWSSPSTARASAVARLLFMAMWNWADDSGHGTANLKELEGFAFPHDDISDLSGGKCRNFRHCIAEVSECFGVVFYNVRGRMYYEIPSWPNHQRNERLAKGKHPLPEDGEIVDITRDFSPKDDGVRKMSEVPTHNHGSSGAVSGDQGVMVTGVKKIPSPATPPRRFDEFWDWYPRKVGKADAKKAYAKAAAKFGEQVLVEGAERLRLDPNLPADKNHIPHAQTWLNGERWNDEPYSPPVPQGRPSGSQLRLVGGMDLLQQTRAELSNHNHHQHLLEIEES